MSVILTYGSVTIEDVVLQGIDCQSVMADDGINFRYREYTISFAGHVNGARNAHLYNNGTNKAQRTEVNYPADTAMTLLRILSRPHQYFKLEMGDRVALESPQKGWHSYDSNYGPKTNRIRVTNVAGDMGQIGRGGYFLVSGQIVIATDHNSVSDGQESTYIQSYTVGWETDTDADNGLMSVMTTVKLYGRPEAILNKAVNAAGQSVTGLIPQELGDILQYIPDGFRRKRAKVQVTPGGVEAMILLIDVQTPLPLGIHSPTSMFEPMHNDTYRWSGEKEGAAQRILTIVIRAANSRHVPRESVAKQMFYWVALKGFGGFGGGIAAQGGKIGFLCYLEASMSTNYATYGMELTVRCKMIPFPNGAAGIPYSPTNARIKRSDDEGDIDAALAPYTNGERPGSEPWATANPKKLFNYQTAGTMVMTELRGAIWPRRTMQETRNQPDGHDAVCGTGVGQSFPIEPAGPSKLQQADFEFDGEFADTLTLDESPLGWKYAGDDRAYESTWMSTKYKTAKGTMRLPTAGIVPAGSTPSPGDIKSRVEVKMHEPITEKVVSWGIQIISPYAPDYPDPTHLSDPTKYTLKHEEVQPAACVAIGPGMYAWTITGKYYYDCEDELNAGKSLSAGILPTSPGSVTDYNIPGGAARPGYIS